jgi:hypothetical protein
VLAWCAPPTASGAPLPVPRAHARHPGHAFSTWACLWCRPGAPRLGGRRRCWLGVPLPLPLVRPSHYHVHTRTTPGMPGPLGPPCGAGQALPAWEGGGGVGLVRPSHYHWCAPPTTTCTRAPPRACQVHLGLLVVQARRSPLGRAAAVLAWCGHWPPRPPPTGRTAFDDGRVLGSASAPGWECGHSKGLPSTK